MNNRLASNKFKQTFLIGGHPVGESHDPFIIAEFSGNHGHDQKRLEAMVVAAAEAGVHAIKLQTYTPDTITVNSDHPDFIIKESSSLWQGETLYSLYEKAYTPWEWHKSVFKLARKHGLVAFSSPFDETSVDYLESLDVPCYKIASFELTHFPLLRAVARTKKPVILSTGMATRQEITDAVDYLGKNGCTALALLKCTSCYPAPVEQANLATIEDMKQYFGIPVGLSDHSQGVGVALLAAGLGADIIERHFTLDRNVETVDAAFSSTPDELKILVEGTRGLKLAAGKVTYGPTDSERDSLRYRRSIYIAKPLEAGEVLTQDDLKVVRPALGLAPKYYDDVLGRTLAVPKDANTPLYESDLL